MIEAIIALIAGYLDSHPGGAGGQGGGGTQGIQQTVQQGIQISQFVQGQVQAGIKAAQGGLGGSTSGSMISQVNKTPYILVSGGPSQNFAASYNAIYAATGFTNPQTGQPAPINASMAAVNAATLASIIKAQVAAGGTAEAAISTTTGRFLY